MFKLETHRVNHGESLETSPFQYNKMAPYDSETVTYNWDNHGEQGFIGGIYMDIPWYKFSNVGKTAINYPLITINRWYKLYKPFPNGSYSLKHCLHHGLLYTISMGYKQFKAGRLCLASSLGRTTKASFALAAPGSETFSHATEADRNHELSLVIMG